MNLTISVKLSIDTKIIDTLCSAVCAAYHDGFRCDQLLQLLPPGREGANDKTTKILFMELSVVLVAVFLLLILLI